MAGKNIVILGGGIGGLVAANELKKNLGSEHKIIIVDKNVNHNFASVVSTSNCDLRIESKVDLSGTSRTRSFGRSAALYYAYLCSALTNMLENRTGLIEENAKLFLLSGNIQS